MMHRLANTVRAAMAKVDADDRALMARLGVGATLLAAGVLFAAVVMGLALRLFLMLGGL